MVALKTIRAWGTCTDCGYEGMLEFTELPGEDYCDEEAVGVMLLLRCPACDSRDNTLVPMDYYLELRAIAEQ